MQGSQPDAALFPNKFLDRKRQRTCSGELGKNRRGEVWGGGRRNNRDVKKLEYRDRYAYRTGTGTGTVEPDRQQAGAGAVVRYRYRQYFALGDFDAKPHAQQPQATNAQSQRNCRGVVLLQQRLQMPVPASGPARSRHTAQAPSGIGTGTIRITGITTGTGMHTGGGVLRERESRSR